MFTFVESSTFERTRPVYLDEDEYAAMQQVRMQNPEAGEVVPGSGAFGSSAGSARGWASGGGLRVIYFVRYAPNEFWMLAIYAKARADNAPAHILRELLEAFRNG
jgi:hypothetical protein